MAEGRPIVRDLRCQEANDHRSSRTVGGRGPSTLEDDRFLEKLSRFEREGIPELVVQAHGPVAHGGLEATAGEVLSGIVDVPDPVQ